MDYLAEFESTHLLRHLGVKLPHQSAVDLKYCVDPLQDPVEDRVLQGLLDIVEG